MLWGSQVTSELPVGVRLLQPGGTSSLARTPLALECVLPEAVRPRPQAG